MKKSIKMRKTLKRLQFLAVGKYLFVVLLAVVSCKSKPASDYDKLKNFYLSHSTTLGNFDKYTSVVVITGKGSSCLNCSNIFALDLAKRYVDNQNLLFIISDDGTKVDISGFVEKNAGNIILDYNNEFSKLGLVRGNAIIDIANHDSLGITEITEANVCSYKIE